MKLLVLGGTQFVGRHVVESAIERGLDVTLFSRGRTNPDAYPNVRRITGDRQGDLSELGGETWDAVIDTWARVPSLVRASASALAHRAGRYVFVSSLSVYGPGTPPGFDEGSPVLPAAAPDEPWNPERYGELKVACEREAETAMPGRTLILRPGLIVGRYDPSDRYTYWVDRIARGGDVLTPGDPNRAVQIVHGSDLAGWMLTMIEREQAGVYNVAGPSLPFVDVLEACRTAAGSDARFVWAPEQWLLDRGVGEWVDMPVWISAVSEHRHLFSPDTSAAYAAGLRSRPQVEIARDVLEWHRRRGVTELAAGLSPEREQALLAELAGAPLRPEADRA